MRFILLSIIGLVSYNISATTNLELSGQSFKITASFDFDVTTNSKGTIIAETRSSGLCKGKLSIRELDDDQMAIFFTFDNDPDADHRYCKGNDTTVDLSLEDFDNLVEGKKISVRYKSNIQMQLEFTGALKMTPQP